MDADRFDSLIRHLTAIVSRRDVPRALAGASAGGALGLFGLSASQAKSKHRRKRKRKKPPPRNGGEAGITRIDGQCVVGQAPCPTGANSCGSIGMFCIRVSGPESACCTFSGGRSHCAAPCPTPPRCAKPEDCPDTEEECVVRTSDGGRCGKAFAPEGTPLPAQFQTAGDCRKVVCDGTGGDRADPDYEDFPDDGNECTLDACENGRPIHTPRPVGTPCNDGAGQCDADGNCQT